LPDSKQPPFNLNLSPKRNGGLTHVLDYTTLDDRRLAKYRLDR
jgi:hypothetical protein